MIGKNEAQKIEVLPKNDEKNPIKKKRRLFGWRFKLACIGFFITLASLCFAALAFLWFGGYIKDWTCDSVNRNSQIWDTLECAQDTVAPQTEDVFDYSEGDEEIVISDLETIITDVVQNSSPAVVSIGISGNQLSQDQVIGTGFIVSSNGLIVTNRHVVSEGTTSNYFVLIKDKEQKFAVEEIYEDFVNDIAIIKVNSQDLSIVPLGNSDELKVGQTVIAIGNPLGDLTGSVTSGIISGLDREVSVGSGFNTDIGTFEGVIQTDAAVNPGNSGGPLLDSSGRVIGVNFATVQGADNLSFAIPINRIKQRIDELKNFGEFKIPFLGVEYRQRVVFFQNQGLIGALVVSVVADSPAQKGGIEQNDIIVQFNGTTLEENSLFNLIQKSEIGQEVEIVVLRDGEEVTLNVTIGEN